MLSDFGLAAFEMDQNPNNPPGPGFDPENPFERVWGYPNQNMWAPVSFLLPCRLVCGAENALGTPGSHPEPAGADW